MNRNAVFVTLILALVFCALPIWPNAEGDTISILDRLLRIETELVPPAGSVIPYAGAAEPKGWLFCDGREISRASYSDLFQAIHTAYGEGNGSTTFNLPDLRGRAPIGAGKGDGLTNRERGGKVGCENQSSNVAVSQQPAFHVPAHYHGKGNLCIKQSGNHAHSRRNPANWKEHIIATPWEGAPHYALASGKEVTITDMASHSTDFAAHSHSNGDIEGNVGNAQGSNGDTAFQAPRSADVTLSNAPVNNMPPSLVVNYIVKH